MTNKMNRDGRIESLCKLIAVEPEGPRLRALVEELNREFDTYTVSEHKKPARPNSNFTDAT